jgi:hypothetical protein
MRLDPSRAVGETSSGGQNGRSSLELPGFPSATPRSRADRLAGAALEKLRDQGFLVVLDIEQEDGTFEHLVSGPSGVFLIEARHSLDHGADLAEMRSHAEELRVELDTWVTPVVCLTGLFAGKPRRREKVWLVHRREIARWIASRRNPVLESGTLFGEPEPS